MKIYNGTGEKVVGMYVRVCVCVFIACAWVVLGTLPQSRYRGYFQLHWLSPPLHIVVCRMVMFGFVVSRDVLGGGGAVVCGGVVCWAVLWGWVGIGLSCVGLWCVGCGVCGCGFWGCGVLGCDV